MECADLCGMSEKLLYVFKDTCELLYHESVLSLFYAITMFQPLILLKLIIGYRTSF